MKIGWNYLGEEICKIRVHESIDKFLIALRGDKDRFLLSITQIKEQFNPILNHKFKKSENGNGNC
jgi:hypothetical protein